MPDSKIDAALISVGLSVKEYDLIKKIISGLDYSDQELLQEAIFDRPDLAKVIVSLARRKSELLNNSRRIEEWEEIISEEERQIKSLMAKEKASL